MTRQDSPIPLPNLLANVRDHYLLRNVTNGISKMLEDRMTTVYFLFLVTVLVLGLVGPHIAPYEYDETLYTDDGEVNRLAEPSLEHPLGTNDVGQDVLSRVLNGAQPTVITGLLGGGLIIGIGMTIGITAGYVGGRVENVLMRFTDVMYGVPLIPFAIVLVAFFGVGFIESIVVIGLVLWRGNARVLRSQVLQIKERPFVLAARTTGASRSRIIFKHIFPNVASMAVLFFALGVGYSIIIQAGLAFIGVSNPYVPSWGIMVRNAYDSGYMATAWWWSVVPGVLISLTVLSTFMFGRGYETLSGQAQDEALAEMG
ncbi:ABC transporter permease [Halorubellus sp. JP-L1]|uniref:ABC transporter permease n=1 Tax=Halorubellus sp. JP-L1 TaxID=2715753 RepID=UPI00140966CE|nr:ABC transporter permease [Halorubellus sp. JP-L1]NHN42923.1 ABC transporter permease [Halorubellus sp. JP-L1]